MAINTLFQNIANAIRSVNSSSDTYTPEEMPEVIMNLSTGDMLKSEYDPNETVLDAGGIVAYTAEALAGKADSATTLAGYGIANAYTKTETDILLSAKANSATTLAGYGIDDAYTITQVDILLSGKANSSTTLAGYGITDAYTKTETDTLLTDKADASNLSTLSETVGTNTTNIATLNSNLTDKLDWSDMSILGAVNLVSPNYYDGDSKTANGITFTVNADKSISISGTATATTFFNLSNSNLLKAGTYKKTATGNSNIQLNIYDNSSGDAISAGHAEATFTLSEDTYIRCYYRIASGTTVDETLYPMISPSSYTGDYIPPVATNSDLTELTCPTNTNGTYTLQATVSGGVVTYSWVATS